jgi:outer membrane receptor for ferrienterochelin and colicins
MSSHFHTHISKYFIRRCPLGIAFAATLAPSLTWAQAEEAQTSADDSSLVQLEPFTVLGHPSATMQGALKDDIIKTEAIDTTEFAKTDATNLTELMSCRTGIDVQTECSVCNARNITLNNLPGRFTTLLFDGVPIFSSVSNSYGLDMIGLDALERVDISRGAGTSLIAPESLAGSVDLVPRQPRKTGIDVDVGAGNEGFRRGAVDASATFKGGAVTLTGSVQEHDSVDEAGSGISQYTGYIRKLGGFGLFLDDVCGFNLRTHYNHIDEKRMGGPLGDDYDAVRADTTGNPFDFSKGPHGSPNPNGWINPSDGTLVDYSDGKFGMAQIVFTKRDQLVSVAERHYDDTSLRFAMGYARHDQDSWYGGDADYFGRQNQCYLEASAQTMIGSARLTVGTDYRFEDLHSTSVSEDSSSSTYGIRRKDADTYTYRTPALFTQIYDTAFDGKLEANASLRYDYNNVYDGIVTPRLNLLWHHNEHLSSRIAAGQGFRLPTSFFELEHGILTAASVDRSQAKAEKSDNLSYALNYAMDRLAVTASVNHTQIRHMALFVDDTANSGNYLLVPALSNYTIDNADVVGTWQFTKTDSFTAGFERYLYHFNAEDFQGSIFARPDWRATFALDHDAGKWDLNLRATLTGPQNLSKFYDYADTQRYNLDGTPKMNRSPCFWVVDCHFSYQWTKWFSTYAGVNNLFDYRQAKKDSYLWVDGEGSLDVTQIWGPNLGRTFVVGGRLTF